MRIHKRSGQLPHDNKHTQCPAAMHKDSGQQRAPIVRGHTIAPGATGMGTGIYFANSKNISISDCSISLFKYAINASNSTLVSIAGVSVQGGSYGVMLNKVLYGYVLNSLFNGTAGAGILLSNSGSVSVINNSVSQGLMQSVGIGLNNTFNSTVLNNSAVSEYIGMQFSGRSLNNTVSNNTASGSTYAEISVCSPGTGMLNAELGGINYGSTKMGCHWLAALPKFNPAVECTLSQQPNFIQLTQDSEYTFGSTCFTLNANATTVNCNGHTVIALKGGTFASSGVYNSEVDGCYLKGFTAPIVAVNSSVNVFNNTILLSPKGGFDVKMSEGGARLGHKAQQHLRGRRIRHKDCKFGIGLIAQQLRCQCGDIIPSGERLGIYSDEQHGVFEHQRGHAARQFRVEPLQEQPLPLKNIRSTVRRKQPGRGEQHRPRPERCSSVLNCNWLKASSPACP